MTERRELPIYDAVNVAEAVLKLHGGPFNPIALQKILYYIKGWSLGWNTGPIYRDAIQAWANGPVIPKVYQMHRLQSRVSSGDIEQNAASLDPHTQQIVSSVYNFYCSYTADQLISLTHHDAPWRKARMRDNVKPGERSTAQILKADMQQYYAERARVSSPSRVPQAPLFVRL